MPDVLAIIAPVFVAAAVGWGWVRSGRPYDRAMVTRLITDIGAPCLVFTGLVGLDVAARELQLMAGVALPVLGLGIAQYRSLPTPVMIRESTPA